MSRFAFAMLTERLAGRSPEGDPIVLCRRLVYDRVPAADGDRWICAEESFSLGCGLGGEVARDPAGPPGRFRMRRPASDPREYLIQLDPVPLAPARALSRMQLDARGADFQTSVTARAR